MQGAEDAALALRFQEERDHTECVELSTAAEARAGRAASPPGVDQLEVGHWSERNCLDQLEMRVCENVSKNIRAVYKAGQRCQQHGINSTIEAESEW